MSDTSENELTREEKIEKLKEVGSRVLTVTVGDETIYVPESIPVIDEPNKCDVEKLVRPVLTESMVMEQWAAQVFNTETGVVEDELPVESEAEAIREAIEMAQINDLPLIPTTVDCRDDSTL